MCYSLVTHQYVIIIIIYVWMLMFWVVCAFARLGQAQGPVAGVSITTRTVYSYPTAPTETIGKENLKVF